MQTVQSSRPQQSTRPITPIAALRPPLKWAGGKRWQVPYIRAFWEQHRSRRLVEPFCGGLAVALGLMPGRALLNDVNLHLIHFYRCLRRGLIARIPMENSEQLYYRHRLRFNELIALDDDGDESAALFYYLNRTGYNGLCRFNKCGKFNVPFGCYTKINYLRDFSDYVGVLRKWEFMSNDFESVPLKVDDFIYADPPYDVEFRSYTKDGFAWEDQVRTAEWLSHHRGPVILVNMATDRIRKVYRSLGYQLKFLEAPRMISCTGNRTPVKEVLALRNI